MKAVDLLIDSLLPEELQGAARDMDAKSLDALMSAIATKYPDKYESVSKNIADVGRNASYLQGETITLGDLRPTFDKDGLLTAMDRELDTARKADPENFPRNRVKIWDKYNQMLENMTMQSARESGSNLAYSVGSGARGKPAQLKAMLSSPGYYVDYKGDTIPLFVRNSFGQGLRPAEFLAGTYGARTSVLSTKNATARGGDFSKQLSQSAASTIVTTKDCGVRNGIDLETDDPSMKGRVLARDTAEVPAGTILDKHALGKIRKSNNKAVVRSPMTCQAKEGVCAKCVGQFYDNKLPEVGDAVGITAAQSIGEPITQGALNSKHTGGMGKGKREYSGFDVINQLVQSPETFPDRATVAETEGRVESITEAPQGGHYIKLAGRDHYVPAGYDVTAKVGDRVEAGDQLSDGIVDPEDVMRLRGLGSGRRYYAERLNKALADSGMAVDRRNVELVSRGAFDHVRVEDDENMPGYLPDDVTSYNKLTSSIHPPKDAKGVRPSTAVGKFLATPALHYSIGTRITPRMAERLEKSKVDSVYTSDKEPGFRPVSVRLRTAAHSNPDWLASMSTSYLKTQLEQAAVRGDDTNVRENIHFGPRLAKGEGFGQDVAQTGKF